MKAQWKQRSRSFTLDCGDFSADVFNVGGEGWRFNILDNRTGIYVAATSHLRDAQIAMERADYALTRIAQRMECSS